MKTSLYLLLVVTLGGVVVLAACAGPTDEGATQERDETVPSRTQTDAGSDASTTKDAGGELDTPSTCTNGTSTVQTGPLMKPGAACNGCHVFSVAGTVYPTAHEPNDCKGANVGASIEVTDAKGKTTKLAVNEAGNFSTPTAFAFPVKVKVVVGGKERPMTTALTAEMGNCNACHTEVGSGTPKAPGRIAVPK